VADHVIGRGELTHAAWEALKPLLSATDGPGGPWRDHRQVINGVLGPGRASWSRFRRRTTLSERWIGRCRWTPPSTAPTSRRPVPGKGAGANGGLEGPARSAADQALGRSRGGLTTKVHLACDGRGLPLAVVLTPPRNVNDRTIFKAVLESVRGPVQAPGGRGKDPTRSSQARRTHDRPSRGGQREDRPLRRGKRSG
jgi:hypothetical protein